MYEYRVIDKLLNTLNLYKHVGIYGAGISSKKIYNVIEEMELLDNVECFIDQDSSSAIGTFIGTKQVKKIDQAIDNIDVIIVSSIKYWKEIQNRLEIYLQVINCDIKIVSIFEDDKKERRECRKQKREDYYNYQEINLNPYIREKEDPLLIAWYYSNQIQKNKNNKYPAYNHNNISSNVPQYFVNQPDLIKPIDESILYYVSTNDLRRQVDLAKFYGLYGFCFPIFWKNNKNLEYVVEKFIETKDIDFKFCFCITDYILLERISDRRFRQYVDVNNSFENIEKFVEMISDALNDERYICIDDRPLILLGSEYMFAKGQMEYFIKILRSAIVKRGFNDPYFLLGITDKKYLNKFEVDGIFEYPPMDISNIIIKEDIEIINDDFQGHVYDMNKYINHLLISEDLLNEKLYRTVSIGYNDLQESRGYCSDILYGMTPSLYEKWLSNVIAESKKMHKTNNFIFIYAWNAWNKSAALEPNLKDGYAYLQNTLNAIYDNRRLKEDIVKKSIEKYQKIHKRILFYVFCMESMGDIVACEPISRYLKTSYPNSELHWIVKDNFSDLVKYNQYIDIVHEVKNLSEGIELCDKVKKENVGIVIDCHYNNRICSGDKWHVNNNNPQINENTYLNYGSLLESFCLIAGMKPIDDSPIFHESGNRVNPLQGEEYVVFHCTSSEIIKDWDGHKWNTLATHLLEKHIKVVEIGLSPVIVSKNPLYYDYTMKRDLQEIALIIKEAKGFVGIDSGFAHFANCYCKDAVLIFGKYKNFMYPMPYSGYFKENKKEIIIYPEEGKPAYFVEEEKVYEKCKRFLDK
ncbi:glycoside hydrolase family 99-like domain-containing protein [Intestinibacter bartlettii]|uniref:glycoside hydrolase family 99-like domain-containing protein n=1 Tax=Intestinibacter bartlettii TaxID=261299 RepID=UPI0039A18E9A